MIESHESIARYDELRAEQAQVGEEATERDRRWVKCQRLIRLLETLALQCDLASFGSLDEKETFARLEGLEQVVYAPGG